MNEEKVISGYDPQIMRRLLQFLKPYKLMVVFAVLGLFLSTAAELMTPVIMQQAIDKHIVVRFFRIKEGEQPLFADLKIPDDAPMIEGWLYLPTNVFSELSGREIELAKEKGAIDTSSYYVISRGGEDIEEVIWNHQKIFTLSEDYAAVLLEDLSTLPEEERMILRQRDIQGIAEAAVLFFILLAGGLIFSFLEVYLMASTGQGVMKDLRMKILGHTLGQSLKFIDKNPVGSLVTRVTNDVETVNELFTTVATSVLKDISLMVGVVVTLFLLDTRLGFITFLTLPPVFFITLYYRVRARDAYRRVRMWVSKVNAYLSEHISGMEIVQIFGREKRCRKEFSETSGELLKANISEMLVYACFRPIINFLTSLSIGVIIYFGARGYIENLISLGVLIAFIHLIGKFFRPVMDMAEKFTIMQSSMAGGERVFALLDQVERISDTGTEPLPDPVRGKIEFRDVNFSYVEDEQVLKDLAFQVEPGETIAIVGYTGAGKTTIASLLSRLWDVDSGSILLDGIDIRSFPLHELRKMIQPVQQDVFIFSRSIVENIALGSNITREEVERAAKIVFADSFIRKLPEGYDTILDERGANLSTGQRQLLSFARVVAHDPKVLILDEATGSIDTETEKLIQRALNNLLEGRTSFVIAHRLSTIRHADRILVLSGGELVESGSHSELLSREGVYYNLYKYQYEAGNREILT
ncbi:MAG: ABC transporter ATP-binding protein [Spirochaetales bacterium]|nr:ABC transporter ATP-binding protein [Spirochaetales bacterium]